MNDKRKAIPVGPGITDAAVGHAEAEDSLARLMCLAAGSLWHETSKRDRDHYWALAGLIISKGAKAFGFVNRRRNSEEALQHLSNVQFDRLMDIARGMAAGEVWVNIETGREAGKPNFLMAPKDVKERISLLTKPGSDGEPIPYGVELSRRIALYEDVITAISQDTCDRPAECLTWLLHDPLMRLGWIIREKCALGEKE